MNQPKTLTEAITRINERLDTLGWVDKKFGRAAIQDQKKLGADKVQMIPMAYSRGMGDYEDCRPNDKYDSVVFYVSKEPEKNDYNQDKPFGHAPNHIIRTKRALTLIGWVNFYRVPSYMDDSGFPEQIKIELKEALKWVSCVVSIGDYQDGLLSEVYKPFIVSDMDRKYDRFPFACFRLELVVQTIETNVNR